MALVLAATSLSTGASARQGAHQDAQKLSTTTLPLCAASEAVPPSRVCPSIDGRGLAVGRREHLHLAVARDEAGVAGLRLAALVARAAGGQQSQQRRRSRRWRWTSRARRKISLYYNR